MALSAQRAEAQACRQCWCSLCNPNPHLTYFLVLPGARSPLASCKPSCCWLLVSHFHEAGGHSPHPQLRHRSSWVLPCSFWGTGRGQKHVLILREALNAVLAEGQTLTYSLHHTFKTTGSLQCVTALPLNRKSVLQEKEMKAKNLVTFQLSVNICQEKLSTIFCSSLFLMLNTSLHKLLIPSSFHLHNT